MLKRRGLLLIAVVLMAVAITGVAGSLAWFSATEQANNDFSVGRVNIGIDEGTGVIEYGTGPSYMAFVSNGDNQEKAVKIKNLNTDGRAVPAYIRARVVATWRDATGNGIGAPANITLSGTNSNWELEEGCYYYKLPVAPGDSTEYLMQSVTLNSDVPAGAHLEVQVLADAVQAEGGAALDAWGVDIATL